MRQTGSFRDPASHVFLQERVVFRYITPSGRADFMLLQQSGLLDNLCRDGLLARHELVEDGESGLVLRPEQIPLITYPYEWCFSQLKAAAVLTLEIQERAIEHGMSLKDASAYNVQFRGCKPIFIDLGSFEIYREGEPWIAYRQFCEHFLVPLLLMSKVDFSFARLQQTYLDGLPLRLASELLPKMTWLNPWLNLHIKQHAKAAANTTSATPTAAKGVPKTAVLGLLKTLRSAVEGLSWKQTNSTWSTYSSADSYSSEDSRAKMRLLEEYADGLPYPPSQVWDLGANAGEFSRVFAKRGWYTAAFDIDENAIERNFSACQRDGEANLLPLFQDAANPSPSLGWNGAERQSLFQRGPVDLLVSLAFVHHLVIGNSVPLPMVAEFLARLGKNLIIEFVDNEDPRVQQLRSSRKTFHAYDLESFRSAFASRFTVLKEDQIGNSQRRLFLLQVR